MSSSARTSNFSQSKIKKFRMFVCVLYANTIQSLNNFINSIRIYLKNCSVLFCPPPEYTPLFISLKLCLVLNNSLICQNTKVKTKRYISKILIFRYHKFCIPCFTDCACRHYCAVLNYLLSSKISSKILIYVIYI